ncbi:MAG: metalloregulator ArsR/SmtB family transcription factor [Bacteroidia bacterium]|jgi:DNA-binding transcriptional ArsR family regulator|nr:metalloregulator ArsR/SmtB family transcription factor [Bacteroidia bacterium]
MPEALDENQALATYAQALSHPVRLAIIRRLAEQSVCFHGNMAAVLPVAPSTLSQHLKVLKDAGLIKGEIDPPRVRYCLNTAKIKEIKELFDIFLEYALQGGVENC